MDILVILDRSGSMQDAKSDHEGGLRSFVEDQRGLDGDVRFTLVQFDTQNPCEIVYDRTPIADVKDVLLIPRGGTPLLDAVGRAVSHLRAELPPNENVVVLVITDGEENDSHEWTKDRVKSLVAELEGKGWSFLFLGANVDAFAEAAAIGISATTSLGFSNAGGAGTVGAAYAATSSNILHSRRAMAAGMSRAQAASFMSYTAQQRGAATGSAALTTGTVDEKDEQEA